MLVIDELSTNSPGWERAASSKAPSRAAVAAVAAVPASVLAAVALLLGSAAGAGATPTTAKPVTPTTAPHHAPTTVPPKKAPSTTPTTKPKSASPVIGQLTILSPTGLNVRAAPSLTAKVIGTAAQGVALALVGHTNKNGGWYHVGGATVIGWVSAQPQYTARGRFHYYGAGQFHVLYPNGWSVSGKPKAGVTFRAGKSKEEVVITASTSLAQLPTISGSGISQHSTRQVVACGVTTILNTYTTPEPHIFYADVAIPAGAGHAIGLKATLTSLSEVPTVLDFVNSLSFPLPICVGPVAKH